MFSSKSDNWATPIDFFKKIESEFWPFDLDPASDESNHKAPAFFTKEDDGLSKYWFWKVWLNPPYGRWLKDWVKKCFVERERALLICLLIPARTDTSYFHDYIYNKPWVEIRFIRGRLKFWDATNSAPFPSMLVLFYNIKK